MEILSVTAYSQTELTVTWAPPQFLGTSDPLLLRYNLYYSDQSSLDEKSEVMYIIPQLPDDFVTVRLSNLIKGTKYVIGVAAVTSAVNRTRIKIPTLNIVVSTYGEGLLLLFIIIALPAKTRHLFLNKQLVDH